MTTADAKPWRNRGGAGSAAKAPVVLKELVEAPGAPHFPCDAPSEKHAGAWEAPGTAR